MCSIFRDRVIDSYCLLDVNKNDLIQHIGGISSALAVNSFC